MTKMVIYAWLARSLTSSRCCCEGATRERPKGVRVLR